MSEYGWKSYGAEIRMPNASNAIMDLMLHHVQGKHGSFKGRKYRRGKDRCKICGSPKTAADEKILMDIPRIYWGNTTK